jgi:hypothetical protein
MARYIGPKSIINGYKMVPIDYSYEFDVRTKVSCRFYISTEARVR